MFSKFKSWLRQIKPRYFLSLDEKLYDENRKSNGYRFKIFGEHSFPVFTYMDIFKNNNIMYSINPYQLIEIALDEHQNDKKKHQYKISEYLRGNRYKISNFYNEKILSGEEICESPSLLEKIDQKDIYKIAYHTGFVEGRRFSKQLSSEVESKSEIKTPVKLKIIPK